MRLMRFLALVILSACGPNRPKISLCSLRTEALANLFTHPKGQDFQVPVADMDKYFGLKDADAILLLEYVTDLEAKAARCGK